MPEEKLVDDLDALKSISPIGSDTEPTTAGSPEKKETVEYETEATEQKEELEIAIPDQNT